MSMLTKEYKAAKAAIVAAETDLKALIDMVKTLGADAALLGLSTLPPPAGTAADVASLAVSLGRGDWGSALWDVVGFIPLFGDAAKAAGKGTKIAKQIKVLEKGIAKANKKIAQKKQALSKLCNKSRVGKGKSKQAAKDSNCQVCGPGGKSGTIAGKSAKPKPGVKNARRLKQKNVPCFKKNKKGKPGEYDRQLKDQENGLNDLTAEEYLKGRDAYKSTKRKSTAQTRKKYKDDLIENYTDAGMSKADATKKAESKMKTLHALHNPDLIAGGKDKTTTMGDKSVNQSIGSQWKKRVDDLDKEAKHAIKTQKGKSKMNVKLKRCK